MYCILIYFLFLVFADVHVEYVEGLFAVNLGSKPRKQRCLSRELFGVKSSPRRPSSELEVGSSELLFLV